MAAIWHWILAGAGLLLAGWLLYVWFAASEEKLALAVRLALTALVVLYLVKVAGPLVAQGGYTGGFVGIPLTAAGGLALALIWGSQWGEAVGRWFGGLYDEGRTRIERRPVYSVAEALRKRGRYREAAQRLREIIAEFPDDFQAHLMLAEILVQNLGETDQGMALLEQWAAGENRRPGNVAFAYARLADWSLHYGNNPDAAKRYLEEIVLRFPESPQAHAARQRLAHMDAQAAAEASRSDRRVFEAPQTHVSAANPPQAPDPAAQERRALARAEALVRQLEVHPHDNAAREELALLYAQELGRPDLAIQQLEELMNQRHASVKQLERWTNLAVELWLKDGDASAARRLLEQFAARCPGTPEAEQARHRILFLEREARVRAAHSAPLRMKPKRTS